MRNSTFRSGHRLALGMRARRGQLNAVDNRVLRIVVEPVFTRFKTGNHRMPTQMKVPGRVLARRGIATAYVSAFGATPQVQPPATARQTLEAAVSGWLYRRIDTSRVPVRLVLHAARSRQVQLRGFYAFFAKALRLTKLVCEPGAACRSRSRATARVNSVVNEPEEPAWRPSAKICAR